ncbi:MAG: fumarate hydratase [Desulforhopalus sp.]|nr:fumarate hydratase [Desulforhopalus sp.]
MTIIKKNDFIDSIADSLQYISYYHPLDFVKAMHLAYQREQNKAAKDAIGQILINSKMAAIGKRPMCQDTGIVNVFIKIGTDCKFDTDTSIQEMVDEGARRAYSHPDNTLRKSVVAHPATDRKNTRDNTPAVVYTEIVAGGKLEVHIAAKGGGSENKSKVVMLNPSDSIVEWVKKTVPTMGAGWCPPGIIGIGVGGTVDKAVLLAKESLMQPIDIQELIERGPANKLEELRLEIYKAINDLGIGAQGLGGLTTVLDVKIAEYPTHAASLPVAMIPNCAAARHTHFVLDGSGPAELTPPDINQWPDISLAAGDSVKRVSLEGITKEEIATWKAGQTLLLNGKILTGRDAAHKRIQQLYADGQPLPEGVDFNGRFIYYVGPVDPVRDEAVGPAGPTTSTRMDKYTDMMLEKAGLFGMIGKSERGDATIQAIKDHKAVYCMAVGGAAYLVSKAIKKSRVVAFADLGMEAIYEFEIEDMPVTVAVDASGEAVHKTGPAFWQKEIAKMNNM